MNSLRSMFLAIASASLIGGASAAERAVLVTLDGGSRVIGLCDVQAVWKLVGSESSADVPTADIKRATFGPRTDPNLENEALVAVGDLQSADFSTREKALAKLKSLGRIASKPLRQAMNSTDAETARQAKTLMAELGIPAIETKTPDQIELKDGKLLNGETNVADFAIRTRWGKLEVPVEAVNVLEFIQDSNSVEAVEKDFSTSKRVANEVTFVPMDLKAVSESATRWDPMTEVGADPHDLLAWRYENKNRILDMERILKVDPKDSKVKLMEATPGDRIEDAFIEKGVQIRATDPAGSVEIANGGLGSFSSQLNAIVKKSDVEFTFNRSSAKGGRSASGVFFAGAFVSTEGPGTIGLAAYDHTGRLLGQTLNEGSKEVNGQKLDIFIGLRSTLPIARLRLYRAGSAKEKGADLQFDDFVFDRPVPCDLRAGECRVETTTGELLAGRPLKSETGKVSLTLSWLGEKSEPATLSFNEIKRYEVAHGKKPAPPVAKDTKEKKPRPRAISPHGVLLQSGEQFHARLISMNEREALFLLAKGVEITLPKSALKRIDLILPPPDEKFSETPNAAAPDEKPGVILKTIAGPGQPGAPLPPKEEIKDPTLNPAQGVERIDDVEIVGVDPKAWMLILKDENGNDFPIGMPGVKTLIFPRDKNAVQSAQKRGWTLTLREGSSFDVLVKKITPDEIIAEMAGGEVMLPANVVESVERSQK